MRENGGEELGARRRSAAVRSGARGGAEDVGGGEIGVREVEEGYGF